MTRTVLFICTGNYYRSRFAEIFFNWDLSANAASVASFVEEKPRRGLKVRQAVARQRS
jgi:protein-tyrosine-phosphatase